MENNEVTYSVKEPEIEYNLGWIKLHRKIKNWEWYKDTNTKIVFLHLLLNANHRTNKWQGKTIDKGQLITSLKNIGQDLGLSVMQVRTSLNKLKLTNEITIAPTNKYTLITIINYSDYQNDEILINTQNNTPDNNRVTNEQQTNNKQITTNKNDKKNNIFEQIWILYEKKVGKKQAEKSFLKIPESEYEKIIAKIPDYVKSTPELQYRKNLSTWLNQECWRDEILKRGFSKMETTDETIEIERNPLFE